MFGLGPTELILILALVMIIFGAGKLPQVFGSLGKGIKEFRTASEEMTATLTPAPASAKAETNTTPTPPTA